MKKQISVDNFLCFYYLFIFFLRFFGKVRFTMDNTVAGLTLTSGMSDGLINTITANLGVLLPIGLVIMGIMVAVSLIPRIIYKFL